MQEMAVDVALLVTSREEETIDLGGKTVRIVPAWRWLLEPW